MTPVIDQNVIVLQQLKTPSLWKVIIINDDHTPMDFVVSLLLEVFEKSFSDAIHLTKLIHTTGSANVGLYTKEIALTKVAQVISISEQFGHPLQATAEEA